MKTALIWMASRLAELIALVILPLMLMALLMLGRFAVVTVLPALLLVGLAVVSGAVRTTSLLAFGLIAVLRGVMAGVDRLGERAPSPRFLSGVIDR
ncbi:hypothetical protein [Saccharopolyspora shandongensis]|uniref:hypothetical protein n=1 Tax=Saccharopolyspora shandongensis TaxID=418495 RepID=UPI0033F975C7